MRIPSDITMCLPWRKMRKPAFSKAFTASRWLTLGILGTSHRYLHFANFLVFDKVIHGSEVFTNGVLNICERFRFSFALRPTTRQTGTRNAEAFFRFMNENLVIHIELRRDYTPRGF